MRLRHLALVAAALAVLSAIAWAGQQRTSRTDPVLSSVGPPSLAAQPSTDAVPAAAPAAAPAARAVSPVWVSRTAAASGVSQAAVAAYGDAVLGSPSDCGLGWTTLAGIGWIESEQGTIGGRTLLDDGRPSTAIVGPALDGGAFGAIPATSAGTALHGDPSWDHAVGPLQFLPSTWQTWGRDGDGDGVADPQDIDDAAAAAAAYLCGTGQDLATGSGWSSAVFAYNHSDTYVQQVYSAASTYAARTR